MARAAKKVSRKGRKATPAQLAALKKARAKLKVKYGTTNISEIAKMKGKRRGATKKRAARRTVTESRRRAQSEQLQENRRRRARRPKEKEQEEENEMALEENPRRRRRRKASKKRRRSHRRREENPRRKRRSHKRRTAKRRSHRRRPARAHRRRTHRRRAHRRREENPRRRRRSHRRRAANPTRRHRRSHHRRRTHHRRRSYRRNPAPPMYDNPGMLAGMNGGAYGGLLNNPMGPYSQRSLVAYGWAVGGIGIGLVIADIVDRYVATRKPADAKSGAKANNPWYGRDAAAAMARRPDGVRLGVQAIGGVASLGLAYAARRNRILPWLLGGTAIGFGSNLAMKLINWWVMPAILKVKDPTEVSAANRLYPLEQKGIQDSVAGMFEAWDGVGSLAAGQQPTPTIASPLSDTPSSDVYTLGRPGQDGANPLFGAAGHQGLNDQSGRVGACQSCGGMPGHFANCPACPDCPGGSGIPGTDDGGGGSDGGGQLCSWVVQQGDDLLALVNAAGVSVNDVSALNGGGEPSTYWYPGNTVKLPYPVCSVILQNNGGQPVIPKIPPTTTTTRTAQPTTPPPQMALPRQPAGGGGVVMTNVQNRQAALPAGHPATTIAGTPDNESRSMAFGRDEAEDE